ncbi:hypothetical protein EF847_08835 [Actinobacteria bacterium YIM 96077]|uniref:Transporter n=1 Tax=Phytoactinopolyspora halophila TaxID=1981511 RepID=A0A329QVF5_9ACTN|nr:hypothetical protein [Phytoactinopolyspora halophila]AYY12803.1 hypothetical protein EF847_08835 [Actinobacteria bacterium YIM 96077]RAW16404.1 hypothetical protein DPM12_07185 [Phytoactinopolyspora halophila]
MATFLPAITLRSSARQGNEDHLTEPVDAASSWIQFVMLVVALKLQLLGNGFKVSNARLVAGLIGAAAGFGVTVTGVYLIAQLRTAQPSDTYLVLVIGGSLIVVGWLLLPVLIFGVDESIDPHKFALLPIPRNRLLVGMLAAGFAGLPAAATLVISVSTVIPWSRHALAALVAFLGAILLTMLCVVASRMITTALSEVLRSRRIRDLLSVSGLLVAGSLVLLQLGLPSMAQLATREFTEQLAGVLAWTPLAAAWAAPYDVVTGAPALGFARLAIVAATIAVLILLWGYALRRSLERGAAMPGNRIRSRPSHTTRMESSTNTLAPWWARRFLPSTVTGAVAARVLRLWWRDPRQRVSLLIIPIVLVALVAGPSIAGLHDDVLVLAAPGIGTLLGLMMLNHTAYDGTALWMHLAASLPGRTDRAGRALGTAVWAVPVVSIGAMFVCLLVDRPVLLPATVGSSVGTVFVGLAFASITSVVIAFPAAPAGANPFVSPSGGNVVVVLQQFLGGLVVGLLSLPIYLSLGFALWWQPDLGWLILAGAPAYGLVLLRLGNRIGGRYLDEHGPELLRRITPSRT